MSGDSGAQSYYVSTVPGQRRKRFPVVGHSWSEVIRKEPEDKGSPNEHLRKAGQKCARLV
jgi:hypothetical protein